MAALALYYRQERQRENERKWDLISENLTLTKKLDDQTWITIDAVNKMGQQYKEELIRSELRLAAINQMQDQLSGILCPRNDHVWEEVGGVKRCRKCGRVVKQDA